MTRPRKETAEKKSRYLQVRVTNDEKDAFDQAAALEGVDMSVWVRLRLRAAARVELEKAGKKAAFTPGKLAKRETK